MHVLLATSAVLRGDPLQIALRGGPDSTNLKDQTILTEVSWLVEEDRQWKSRKATYLKAVAIGHISYHTSPVEARIERHLSSIPTNRIRGYRDKGSRRPSHKWLPPPPSVEVEPDKVNPQAELEDFFLHRNDSP
jgi:hypothetical protein